MPPNKVRILLRSIPLNTTSRTVTFGEANTYSGPTTVGPNLVLTLTNNLALQNSSLNTGGGGTVTLGTGITSPTMGGLTNSTALASVMTTGYSSVTNITLKLGDGVVAIYTGAIADGASGMTITKTGNGTQALNGTSSYSGGTILNAGSIAFRTSGSPLGSGGLTIVASPTNRKLTLGGNSTYTGPTTVVSGILELKSANALSSATALDIRSGAEVRLSFAGTNVIDSLTVNGVLQKRGVYAAGSLPGLTGTAGAYLQTLGPPPKGTLISVQ